MGFWCDVRGCGGVVRFRLRSGAAVAVQRCECAGLSRRVRGVRRCDAGRTRRWIPAFAGMTGVDWRWGDVTALAAGRAGQGQIKMDPSFRWDDEVGGFRWDDGKGEWRH